ncbi:mitochondrial phosphate carrier protein 3 [Carex littledalei]|uniref:Mitochondrial phosphate carrier protein 3 n=1 Tax=Carex littledalei TaxID=544730 RepID=A0A833VS77_9POAL|nr:mitochondrial phosphate carrier protein 3 [Carex littledalei]
MCPSNTKAPYPFPLTSTPDHKQSQRNLNPDLSSFLQTPMAMSSPSPSSRRNDDPFKPLFLAVDQFLKRRPELESVEAKQIEKGKIEMHSPLFYVACTVGGMLSCGLSHMAITPLDLVKCNMQIDPVKYNNIMSGFVILLREQGFNSFFKGWVPTLVGYSAQGACKFGLYEFFKKLYSDTVKHGHQSVIYLAASASAEMFADVMLCPMEAIKIRVQTQPGFAMGLCDGLPKFIKSDGALGLYKGLVPLWGRQIPYTMMKFASFEAIVEAIYKHVVPKPKDQCSKPVQLAISFAGGYLAGVLCGVVSHPADNLVSFLNSRNGATIQDAVRNLGFWGLFTRGLPLRIIMIGTLTGLQWVIYDAFKVSVGLPTTGGVPAAIGYPIEHEEQY